MASRVKDALSRAKPTSRSIKHKHPKATIAVTAATPENVADDAAFAEAYQKLEATTKATITADGVLPPQQQPRPRLPRRASPTDGSDVDPKALHTKYKLRITAGPSYDQATHALVHVNTPHTVLVDSPFVRARIAVRIKDFSGLPLTSPASSPYFDAPRSRHARDRYSIAFSFVPKADLPAADAVWGPDFAHPVRDRLPPGFNTAVGIVKRWVDPSIECDAYADEPWLYAPALSCWFVVRVGEKRAGGGGEKDGGGAVARWEDIPSPNRTGDDGDADGRDVLDEGADGDDGAAARRAWGCPDDAAKRRKWFVERDRREGLVFEKGRLYQGDFFNPYLDFDKFALRLPGFSLGVLRYIDDKTHTLRWVFKNRATGDVYFVVIFELLFGEQLEDALRAEEAEHEAQS